MSIYSHVSDNVLARDFHRIPSSNSALDKVLQGVELAIRDPENLTAPSVVSAFDDLNTIFPLFGSPSPSVLACAARAGAHHLLARMASPPENLLQRRKAVQERWAVCVERAMRCLSSMMTHLPSVATSEPSLQTLLNTLSSDLVRDDILSPLLLILSSRCPITGPTRSPSREYIYNLLTFCADRALAGAAEGAGFVARYGSGIIIHISSTVGAESFPASLRISAARTAVPLALAAAALGTRLLIPGATHSRLVPDLVLGVRSRDGGVAEAAGLALWAVCRGAGEAGVVEVLSGEEGGEEAVVGAWENTVTRYLSPESISDNGYDAPDNDNRERKNSQSESHQHELSVVTQRPPLSLAPPVPRVVPQSAASMINLNQPPALQLDTAHTEMSDTTSVPSSPRPRRVPQIHQQQQQEQEQVQVQPRINLVVQTATNGMISAPDEPFDSLDDSSDSSLEHAAAEAEASLLAAEACLRRSTPQPQLQPQPEPLFHSPQTMNLDSFVDASELADCVQLNSSPLPPLLPTIPPTMPLPPLPPLPLPEDLAEEMLGVSLGGNGDEDLATDYVLPGLAGATAVFLAAGSYLLGEALTSHELPVDLLIRCTRECITSNSSPTHLLVYLDALLALLWSVPPQALGFTADNETEVLAPTIQPSSLLPTVSAVLLPLSSNNLTRTPPALSLMLMRTAGTTLLASGLFSGQFAQIPDELVPPMLAGAGLATPACVKGMIQRRALAWKHADQRIHELANEGLCPTVLSPAPPINLALVLSKSPKFAAAAASAPPAPLTVHALNAAAQKWLAGGSTRRLKIPFCKSETAAAVAHGLSANYSRMGSNSSRVASAIHANALNEAAETVQCPVETDASPLLLTGISVLACLEACEAAELMERLSDQFNQDNSQHLAFTSTHNATLYGRSFVDAPLTLEDLAATTAARPRARPRARAERPAFYPAKHADADPLQSGRHGSGVYTAKRVQAAATSTCDMDASLGGSRSTARREQGSRYLPDDLQAGFVLPDLLGALPAPSQAFLADWMEAVTVLTSDNDEEGSFSTLDYPSPCTVLTSNVLGRSTKELVPRNQRHSGSGGVSSVTMLARRRPSVTRPERGRAKPYTPVSYRVDDGLDEFRQQTEARLELRRARQATELAATITETLDAPAELSPPTTGRTSTRRDRDEHWDETAAAAAEEAALERLSAVETLPVDHAADEEAQNRSALSILSHVSRAELARSIRASGVPVGRPAQPPRLPVSVWDELDDGAAIRYHSHQRSLQRSAVREHSDRVRRGRVIASDTAPVRFPPPPGTTTRRISVSPSPAPLESSILEDTTAPIPQECMLHLTVPISALLRSHVSQEAAGLLGRLLNAARAHARRVRTLNEQQRTPTPELQAAVRFNSAVLTAFEGVVSELRLHSGSRNRATELLGEEGNIDAIGMITLYRIMKNKPESEIHVNSGR